VGDYPHLSTTIHQGKAHKGCPKFCYEFIAYLSIEYPDLVALLLERGATDEQVHLFAGENLLRVWGNIEKAGKQLRTQGRTAVEAVWEGRLDTWPVGLVNSPFMYRETRERLKGHGGSAYYFNVDAQEGVHKPDAPSGK
jgi:membrane dipeptidase